MSLVIPMALFCPEPIEAAVLIIAPGKISIHDRLGDLLCADDAASHFDLLANAGDNCHLSHLASKGSLGQIGVGVQALSVRALKRRKRDSDCHGKVEAICSWLSSGEDEQATDSCPENWLGGSRNAQAGDSADKFAKMSLHNYSLLLSIHVATRPQNEA